MTTLYLDLETYCETPIKNGVYRYAEQADIILFAYALDDGPVRVWDRTADQTIPSDLSAALNNTQIELCAHNTGFDRTVLRQVMPEYPLYTHRWYDTMIQAYAHSLPGALGDLCSLLNVPVDQAKDKEGRKLITLFCKPRPLGGKIARATRQTHPKEWAQLVHYAGQDIKALRAIRQKMPTWSYTGEELNLWHLDQTINDRGVKVDVELAHAALRAVNRAQKQLAARVHHLTDGKVQSATQRDQLLKHLLSEYHIDLPDLQQSTLERRVNDLSLPQALRELLAIRLQASTTSTAKYQTLINGVNSDQRLRGTLQFNGASRTGRWAGRLFQPQNLPRPSLPQDTIDQGLAALKADCEDLLFDDVMQLTSSALRGCLIAPQGKKLVIADLSNIEGRVLAWLAGEDWKLQAFRDYDQGTGHDLYNLAYAKSFGVKPEDVSKEDRQIGKVQELALGYEGGVGAFIAFASVYNIDLENMAQHAWAAIPNDLKKETAKAYGYATIKNNTFGLSSTAWQTCDAFKRSWRNAHPQTVNFWAALQDAVTYAITNPGTAYACQRVTVHYAGNWLRIKLPSGRFLCYPNAKIENQKIHYKGNNQYSKKWSWLQTYGGKLAENITQAVSRDLLAAAMPKIEQAGYKIVLTVHDEIISETPDNTSYSPEQLAQLMTTAPNWADGLPLAAAGFQTYRYRKD